LIPTPIQQVLSTIRANGVQALLMGGQACVFYGAAQVSKDIDLVLLASEENFSSLGRALEALEAKRIAVPPFSPEVLARGHAVHFRCFAQGLDEIRLDVMTRLRGVPGFGALWERRTVLADPQGQEYSLLSVPDLVLAKKTQRPKDWPMIDLLVAIHYQENRIEPREDWIQFWLREARTPELIDELILRFPLQATKEAQGREPLRLSLERADDERIREALDAEIRAEQARDRAYWAPLKAELSEFRRLERELGSSS
jgi:hypothetical protein